MKRTTVLLVDDHAGIRRGIRAMLEVEGSVEIVGEAQNGRQAVEMVRKLRPAVVLMDIAMPEINGLEATRRILKSHPSTRVLMLSAYDDDAYVDQAIAVGSSGYLVKQSSAEILSKAIAEAEKGNTYFSDSVSARLGVRNQNAPEQAGLRKTGAGKPDRRAAKKLQLIAQGKAKKHLASESGIG